MKIGFIGAGRVATHLAKAFTNQHQVSWIYSRAGKSAQHLAESLGSSAIKSLAPHVHDVELIIIAVSDEQITTVAQQLPELGCQCLVVHTSGSTHINILLDKQLRSGVLYPLQTFSYGREIDWLNTPLFVEAIHLEDQQLLMQLATVLSHRVYQYSSEQRLSLHLAAVFACNFSNYCYDMAKQIVDQQQVDFSLLYPLIVETANKATQHDPKLMQTGPAMRGDVKILNMHQELLNTAQQHDFAQVYQLLSQQILQRHQPKE